MNDQQVAYLIALLALTYPAWGRQRYALLALWGNLLAMLGACLAMDLDLLDRIQATKAMLTIDLWTGTIMALRPGLSRIIAMGYAISVQLYFVNLVFGVQISTAFAIIYVVAFAQLAVLGIGTLGGNSGGGLRGHSVYRAYSPVWNGRYQAVLARLSPPDRLP